MKKLMTMMIVMSVLSMSCSKSGGGSSGQESATDTAAVESGSDNSTNSNSSSGSSSGSGSSSSLPALALSFGTNVDLINFTSSQASKYNQAVALVKKVVGTEKFRTQVLNHKWNGSKTYSNNQGKTNAQIYQTILDAAEKLSPAKNNTMDIGVKLYYEASTVIGYTNGSIDYINVNTKYFNSFEINEVAGNLFHEWLHKLGYGHDYSSTAQRPYSVPYAIGYMVRDIGKSFI